MHGVQRGVSYRRELMYIAAVSLKARGKVPCIEPIIILALRITIENISVAACRVIRQQFLLGAWPGD